MEQHTVLPVQRSRICYQRQTLGYEVRVLRFYDSGTLWPAIYADLTGQTAAVENQEVSLIAFIRQKKL